MFDLPLENFVLRDGKETLCQPGLVLALFTPTLEGTENLRSPLDAFLRRFGSQLEWYLDDPQASRSKKIPLADRATFLAKLASEAMDAKKCAVLELRGSSRKGEWVPPIFVLHKWLESDNMMSIWMAVPLPWFAAEGPDGLNAFLDEMFEGGFPFRHGYVGLGLVSDHLASFRSALKSFVYEAAIQHPGLMATCASGQAVVASHGLVDIGWMTLLAAAEAEKAGGIAGIRARLDDACKDNVAFRALPGGALAVRAGELPAFGDVNDHTTLACQHAVGRALRPLWNGERNARVVLTGFEYTADFAEQGKWANRFFSD